MKTLDEMRLAIAEALFDRDEDPTKEMGPYKFTSKTCKQFYLAMADTAGIAMLENLAMPISIHTKTLLKKLKSEVQ